ncbi:MAG: tetratricopeptide repeat protein [Pseudohongiellaceae bacterium]
MNCPDFLRRQRAVAFAVGLALLPAATVAQQPDRQAGSTDLLLQRAHELADRGSWQAAAELYPLVSDPDLVGETAAGEARARAAIGQYEQAIGRLETLIGDDYAEWREHSVQLAELLRDTGQSARAVEILGELIRESVTPPVRALVQYGDLLMYLGRDGEAEPYLEQAIQRYMNGSVFRSEEVAMVALANWRLDRFHEANSLFSEAVRTDGDNVEAHVLWGRLFQEKYNEADAQRSFSDALEVNRRYTPAMVGLARIGNTERRLRDALEVNPGDAGALTLFGELMVRNERYDEARGFLEEALAVNPESVTALATLAGLAAMQEEMDRYRELEERVDAFSPDNASFYATVAEMFGHDYRFTEAVEYARESIEADAGYWHGRTVLGNNLVRLGEEEEGREHLELAFDNDPFNVLTSNLLQLYDTLDGYATLETEHFRVNMSSRDSLVLWPYMSELLEESWDVLVERYGYEPQVPVIIQVFENSEDFAVRSVGLPDIGPLVGICFGRVVTLISPDDLEANWQEILWHELVHVFTLQMTDNRIPRWLSEGISTWEESQLRPEWGRRQGLDLVRAVRDDQLLHVGSLNAGFSGARSNADLGFAYFQSYLVVDYIVEEYSFDHLLALIDEYGEIRSNAERFENVFDMDLDTFDDGFQRWIRQRVDDMDVYVHNEDAPDEGAGHGHGVRENNSAVMAEVYNNASIKRYMEARVEQNPRDFQAHLQLGIVLFREGDYALARQHLREAHDILPTYAGYPSPPLVMAQVYEAQGNREARMEWLAILLENQQHDFGSAMVLAQDAIDRDDLERADYYIDRAMAINPYRLDVHELAARVAEQQQETARAVQELEIVTTLERNDPVDARTRLARAYLNNGQPGEARTTVLRALEQAPTYEAAQRVLLDALEGAP